MLTKNPKLITKIKPFLSLTVATLMDEDMELLDMDLFLELVVKTLMADITGLSKEHPWWLRTGRKVDGY